MRGVLAVAGEGIRHLRRHPVRSLLTALTSAVAIAVTVNVISLVYGMDADVRQDVAKLGSLSLDLGRSPVIQPLAERAALGEEERRQVEDLLAGLSPLVVPRRQVSGRVRGDAVLERVDVVAAPTTYLRTLDVDLRAGRWFRDDDPDDAVCVLDEATASAAYPGRAPIDVLGRALEVATPWGTASRRVIGVLSDPLTHRALLDAFDAGRWARPVTSGLLTFRNVYVPAGASPGGDYSGITIALPDEASRDEAVRRLREIWPQGEPTAPSTWAPVILLVRQEWMDLMGASSQTGALLGNVVWMIVVAVAVIMITTLNLLTIRQRYDELAVRRCEGARRADVALQITVEGTVTALLGGLGGLPLGLAAAGLLRRIVDFPFPFEARYAVVATGVAILLGLLASVLPARRAARLQPARVLGRRLT